MKLNDEFVATCSITVPLIILATVLLLALNNTQAERMPPQKPEYCQMHEIYLSTGGEYGWPDFNQNYHKTCPSS